MAEPLFVTGTVRDFIRRLYAETAPAVQQVFTEDAFNETLKLSHVRVCCGSDAVNQVEGGGYALPEETPWLAELVFGQSDASALPALQGRNEGSAAIGALPCRALQGIASRWQQRLSASGVVSIGHLSQFTHEAVLELVEQLDSHRILEFYAKARLAMAPLPPIPQSPLDDEKLSALLLRSASDLSLQSGVINESQASDLLNYLTGLVAALDDHYLAKLPLQAILNR